MTKVKFPRSESERSLANDTARLSVAVMKKGTGCRKNSGSPEVMSGRRAAPVRQVVRRRVMDRKPPVLSVGWQMLMKQPDKRLGEAARRDLWHSVEAACHSKHINNIYSGGVERVAATSWLDLHRREDSSDLGFYLLRAQSGRGSCGLWVWQHFFRVKLRWTATPDGSLFQMKIIYFYIFLKSNRDFLSKCISKREFHLNVRICIILTVKKKTIYQNLSKKGRGRRAKVYFCHPVPL